ncbi:MAG: DUF2061 domain-containing protein [Cytophagales bacterium]|nr:DUF2061 domain-containing protein [Cytophagales bacterium]
MDIIRVRHITKAVTWRVVASATTFALAFFIFKDDPNAGGKATLVATIEAGLKLIFYYYHERFWFGFKTTATRKRHLLKSITWRAIATLTTFVITILIFREHPNATEKAGAVALAEVFLKMLIYYIHEEVWYKVNWGLDDRKPRD